MMAAYTVAEEVNKMFKANIRKPGTIGLIVLAAALALGGAGDASSALGTQLWKVSGKFLKSSETSTAKVKIGKQTISWESESTKFEVECKKASGEVELKGGAPGTDKGKSLAFEECSLVKGGTGCEVAASGVTGEEVANWATELVESGGKVYDLTTGVKLNVAVTKCTKPSFEKTWKVTGNVKAELSNSGSKIKAIFPGSEVEGDTLEAEKGKVLLAGEGEFEKEGETLGIGKGEAGEEVEVGGACSGGSSPLFCLNSNNLQIHSAGVNGTASLTVIASKWGTTEIKLHCTDGLLAYQLHLSGLAEGEFDLLGCTLEKPANCVVPSSLLMDIGIQLSSEITGTATGDKPGGSSEEFASFTISGGSCSIAGTYTITGQQTLEIPEGGVSKIGHEIVAKKSGSKLRFGAESASMSTAVDWHLESEEYWLVMLGA